MRYWFGRLLDSQEKRSIDCMGRSEFSYHVPTKIIFGESKAADVGSEAAKYGTRVMLVTTPWSDEQTADFQRIVDSLDAGGLEVTRFEEVRSNPSLGDIEKGSQLARERKIEVMLGVGGGSSIDTAKAIAVGATHPGSPWDYVYVNNGKPDDRTLPIVAVTTTSGTGSHVTPYAVFTNDSDRVKSTIVDPVVFPKIAIVDPRLMFSMPKRLTAVTGFDAFTHAFESYVNVNSNRFVDSLALQAIRDISEYLPRLMGNLDDQEARNAMAYADTLAGISIANVGTTLPHSMGQPISGLYPRVAHGLSLALVYPGFFRLTHSSQMSKFAQVARIWNSNLAEASDEEAAAASVGELSSFLDKLELVTSLDELGIPDSSLERIVDASMECPDTYVNPRIPSRTEVRDIFLELWRREKRS